MDSDEVALRCHRAKSWIRKAEKLAEREPEDLDSQFIFLWIALNALYGQPRVRLDKQSDKTRPPDDLYHLGVFINDLCGHTSAAALVRRRLAPELENAVNLLKIPFLYRDYWDEGLTETTQAKLWNDTDIAQRDRGGRPAQRISSALTLPSARLRTGDGNGCPSHRRNYSHPPLRRSPLGERMSHRIGRHSLADPRERLAPFDRLARPSDGHPYSAPAVRTGFAPPGVQVVSKV